VSNRNIAYIVGSLRQDSINRRLAQALIKLAPANVSFTGLNIGNLPLYNQDHDASPASEVAGLKSAIAAADGLIFFTPEYNRSIPGVLKNAIDHASRPYGQSAWAGKPAGVLGASVGPHGTAMAQQHLRNILAYLDCPTLGQPEVYLQLGPNSFDASGAITDQRTQSLLQTWLDKYLAWVEKFKA
jgi:chromate reductase, NAD(P)H dehydrogenase (quinone)